MCADFGIDALVSPGDQGVALLDLGVDTAVAPGPIRMFADQANPTRNEDFHICSPLYFLAGRALYFRTLPVYPRIIAPCRREGWQDAAGITILTAFLPRASLQRELVIAVKV